MIEGNVIKYHFFVIVNNKDIFERNTKKSIDKLIVENKNCLFHVTFNYNNEFSSIRKWINYELLTAYNNPKQHENSKLVFIHQDVIVKENFLIELEDMLNNCVLDVPALFGFAGIDENGVHHKFMKDSDSFCFTGDLKPILVNSVDEFLFGFDYNIFYKEKIFLSDITGWHAYSAEFSIILRNKGYKTFMFPIYVEHNSVRVNNIGLMNTHDDLYNYYKVELKTLVGIISRKSLLQTLKLKLYYFYVNNFKWKFQSLFIEKLKSFLLDKLRLSYNENRVKQNLIKSFKEVYFIYYSDSVNRNINFDINVENTKVLFRTINTIDALVRFEKKSIILSGINYPVDGFTYIKRAMLNVKKVKFSK